MTNALTQAQQEAPAPAQESGGRDVPVAMRPLNTPGQMLRITEALLFAAEHPLSEEDIAEALPEGADVPGLLEQIRQRYEQSGVNLRKVAGKWQLRTADDLRYLLRKDVTETRKLTRVTLETLAIIAYHQPVTRAEIEEIRGVGMSKGTLDILLDIGWIRLRGRRRTPGRPVTYGVTDEFLVHFGLESLDDLPGLAELKGAGLLDASLPPDFSMPSPASGEALDEDEEPLEQQDEDEPPLEMHLPE